MIKAIEGVITKKEPANLILKTAGGVSYGVAISLFCSAKLERGQSVELNITQIIREDADLLYGFLDSNEQKMFETLIKLSGIGAVTAMAVCSSLNPNAFLNAVKSGDAAKRAFHRFSRLRWKEPAAREEISQFSVRSLD